MLRNPKKIGFLGSRYYQNLLFFRRGPTNPILGVYHKNLHETSVLVAYGTQGPKP